MNLRPAVSRYRTVLAAALSLLLFVAAVALLRRELAEIHMADVLEALGRVPPAGLLLSVVAMAGSYLALSGYDLLALRYLGHAVSYRRAALIALLANAVGHNVGIATLSGGAVRLRLYTALGLTAGDVGALIALTGVTFGSGLAMVAGLSLLLQAPAASALLHVPVEVARALGLAAIAGVAGYFALSLSGWRLPLGRLQLRIPGPRYVLAQLLLAVVDLGCAAATLFCVLPPDAPVSFSTFVAAYVLAVIAGIVSHVPGGLGVFETVLLFALPDAPREHLLAAILAYRAIYFLLPLAVASMSAAFVYSRDNRGRAPRDALRRASGSADRPG